MRIGGFAWVGLGSARRVGHLVVLAVEAEAALGRPQAGDDRELLLEPVEPLPRARERDAVRRVLLLEPAGADAELDPAAAHLVDVRHADRERAGEPEGRARHHRAEPDRAGLAGDAGQRDPRVARPGSPSVPIPR